MQLTASGEVATFLDDNQFGSGQSQDKCGPEIVSLFWHSVAPGAKNPYSAADVHSMAHNDYERFIGPDSQSDQRGTDNETLYKLLDFHGFKHYSGPLQIGWIKAWLNAGYPVIIGGVAESSVHDLQTGGVPYSWDTTGLFHIVLATGIGPGGELLIRDTANIGPSGLVRPGPRHYDSTKLSFTTATMAVPSWLKDPGTSTPPAPPAPDYKKAALDALAQLQTALQHWP